MATGCPLPGRGRMPFSARSSSPWSVTENRSSGLPRLRVNCRGFVSTHPWPGSACRLEVCRRVCLTGLLVRFDVVLMNVAEILKVTMREEYVNWVYARYLDHSDRELLSAIVSAIQNEHRDLSLQDMLGLEPFELADQIPHLLETLREVQATASQSWSDLPETPEPLVPPGIPCALEDFGSVVLPRHAFVLR